MRDKNVLINNNINIPDDTDMVQYDEYLSNFINDIDSIISELKKCFDNSNIVDYKINIDSLMNYASYFGFSKLEELIKNINFDDINSIKINHNMLLSEINKLLSISKKYLNITPSKYDIMDQALINSGITTNIGDNDINYSLNNEGIILIVDDSNLVANFVKKIFSDKYDVIIASDGEVAIKYLSNDDFRKRIKTCLLDLNMPKVDGFGVLDFLNNNNYFVKLPVAIISGIEDESVFERVNTYPIVDVLQKPFNERDIKKVVEKCLFTYF